MLPAQPNNSLIDGLECLQAIASADRPVGSRELARMLGLEPTRGNRLLGTLAHVGLAARTKNRKYAPGPGLHVLAAQAIRGSGLLAKAIPAMKPLESEGLSVALGVLWRGRVCYVVFADKGLPVEQCIGRHALFPALKSSIGQVILAAESCGENDLKEAMQILKVEEGGTETKQGWQKILREVRGQGFAAVVSPGSASIGVAVGDPPLAGLALAGAIAQECIPDLVAKLKSAAEKIG